MKETNATSKFSALYINPVCRKKVQYWADAADGEVSGLGLVENVDGKMVVTDVYILEQECTSTNTEIDPEAISKLMTQLLEEGKDPSKLKFWWHSHVNMGCFWSGTDDECAETLNTEFSFSTVVNKKGESKTRLDLYNPFRITVDNIRLLEVSPEDQDLKEQCKKDVEDKVKSSYYYSSTNYSNGYRKGYYDDYYDGDGYWNKNKSKKIKLDSKIVDIVKFLADEIYIDGYKEKTINTFVNRLITDKMEEHYDGKAGCTQGVGTYDKNDDLCKKCAVKKECKGLTKRLEEDESEFEEESFETTQDAEDGQKEDIEVSVED